MTHDNPPRPTDGADELIVRAARDYNTPGPVPRDEMWTRIAEARRSQGGARPVTVGGRRTRYWVWPSVGVAAAGLVAIGIAIGRGVERTKAHGEPGSPKTVAAVPGDTVHPASNPGMTNPPAIPAKTLASDAVTDAGRAETSTSVAAGDEPSSMSVAYKLAVVNHVVGSEAMIMAFRASARRGDVDPQLAKWSRDLLGETRLLESAAPADDPTMKRLLEDLELVIAQIVQYSNRGTHSPEDLDLIERSIRRRSVISNIRNLSAGQMPSGT